MIDSSSSSTQLKDAISAVESLLGEADCSSDSVWLLFPSHQAKRELKNKQLSGPHMATARQRGMLYVHFKSLEAGHLRPMTHTVLFLSAEARAPSGIRATPRGLGGGDSRSSRARSARKKTRCVAQANDEHALAQAAGFYLKTMSQSRRCRPAGRRSGTDGGGRGRRRCKGRGRLCGETRRNPGSRTDGARPHASSSIFCFRHAGDRS